ncbi:hypothetical protein BT93_L3168 [Corymbia citriodora subsp. variegata]|uniref:Uncharacterized protein n=1 Tax=Corymbia citriodora subsp. variegata TaxID=360336 RepID=A0A8T0CJ29_CORYI|nr:hypothetical protein BT93_L3168 [Corymbia citriodora subsp. variegata]
MWADLHQRSRNLLILTCLIAESVIVHGFEGFIVLPIKSGFVYVPPVIGIYMPTSVERVVFVLSFVRYKEAFLALDPTRPNGQCTLTWSPFPLRSETVVLCKCFILTDLLGRFLNS